MPIQPTNCYICHHTWTGKSPICDNCSGHFTPTTQPPSTCSFCQGAHADIDCLSAAIAQQHNMAGAYSFKTPQFHQGIFMAKKHPYRNKPFMGNYSYPNTLPLKHCTTCNQFTCVETKAGSICTNCKTLIRYPCRNCNSTTTHGLSGDNMQFIECNDCRFIE